VSDNYAVTGNPISHSKSPLIHSAFAGQTAQDILYSAFETPLDGFRSHVDAFRAGGGKGLNVTAPFKLEALALATHRSEAAELAGASNTLRFDGETIEAHNFDGIGLVKDIKHNLDCPIKGCRVLMLGAGGASRGALLPLLRERPAELRVVNRTMSKALALREAFSRHGDFSVSAYEELESRSFDIVINATSASLRGELPPVKASVFDRDCLAYELVYGKGLTPFLKLAKQAGTARHLADGVGMLVEQAAGAFEWWRGVRPETRPLIDRLAVPLT
jgi:shikimate dehydrogenase